MSDSVIQDVVAWEEGDAAQHAQVTLDEHIEPAFATDSEADKAVLSLEHKLDRLLGKSKPSKRQAIQKVFSTLYPKLERHLAQGKTLKQVLAAFNELAGANVCVRTFNAMLAKERALRGALGGLNTCHACGQPLGHFDPEGLHPSSSSTGSEDGVGGQVP